MPQQRSDRGLAAAPIGRWIADTPSVGAKEVKDVAEAARALARPIEQTRKRIRRARASLTRAWIPSPRFLNCKERGGGGRWRERIRRHEGGETEGGRDEAAVPALPSVANAAPKKAALHYVLQFTEQDSRGWRGAGGRECARFERRKDERGACGGRTGRGGRDASEGLQVRH